MVLAALTQGLLVACATGELLLLDMLALEESYFTGAQLAGLSIQAGKVLGTLFESVDAA